LQRSDLDDFVACYHAENCHERKASRSEATPQDRWRPFPYDEIVKRDKCSLDIFWLKDERVASDGSAEPARGNLRQLHNLNI
jgi:type I restriction enzyme M protein